MAYSVLSTMNPAAPSGLFDSAQDSFIATGTSDQMYHLKHQLEASETATAAMTWGVEMIDVRRNLLLAAGITPDRAEAILQHHMPASYQAWKSRQA